MEKGAWQGKPLVGVRLGVFGKGGSGKSTTAILLTRALCEMGYHVCLLDADSTNLGMAQALGLVRSPDPLLEFFGGMVFSGGLVTCPVDDPIPLADADISLERLPQRYQENSDGLTFLVAGKIAGLGPGAGCDGPVAKIARDLRIHSDNQPVVTIIDFKAGFEDSARGVLTGLDWAIVVVDPTTASVEIVRSMAEMVDQIREDVLPATAHLDDPQLVAWANRLYTEAQIKGMHVILNRVPDQESEGYLRDKLAEQGIDPVGVLPEYPGITLSWLRGDPIEVGQAQHEARLIVEHLERAELEQEMAGG